MGLDFTSNQTNTSGSMPPPNPGNGFPGIPGAVTPGQAQQDVMASMLINYNKKFVSGSPAKYRDKEIFSVISQLMMSQKSCSLLVGAPGVGKTKIVEEIARLIAVKSPFTAALNDYVIYELPLTNLMAGTSFRGQLEEKVKDMIEWCEKNKVILFIDEIHQLCGGNSAYESVSQMLKPAMARGSIKIIGATTLQESKNLMDDPAFTRRFNKVQVCELSIDQTKDIIQTVYLPKLCGFYGVGYSSDIADAVVMSAERSKTITCHRPDNAITLLDQVSANTLLQRNYNIATCTDDQLRQTMQTTPLVINRKHVEDFNKELGFVIPANFDSVKNKIFYRDDVIDRIHEVITDYANFDAIFPEGKPFVVKIKGGEKSGRTTLVKEIAKLIDEQPITLDMADYSDAPSLNRIIGSPAGYVGSDSKKEMPFDIVESNPRKVIVLDNFDMCHQVVQDFFRSAMDTAVVKYADNRVIDISKCIIFVTELERGSTRSMGIMAADKKSNATELRLDPLSASEMINASEKMIEQMIAILKSGHTKYNTLPDHLDLGDDDKSRIGSPSDMAVVAKSVILDKM